MTNIKEAAAAVGETMLAAKEKAQEMRRSASQILEQAGTGSEEALHSAASTVRNAGLGSAAALDGIAESTGRRLASAASYLDPAGSCSMTQDLRHMVLRHPGSFLLLAAAVAGTLGFMAGNSRDRERRPTY